ncbi:Serine/threonine-protein kinase HT1 [Thalictrum thalictroides]|uniref:non-specific serine/threonine protein kinase n=1 Tax=Thalictrum thalictroides TaxID=46969 RepID=A0A7J6V968_THATH|nr:Serine/threonine-protein kinase HT1 [Thalictrum thalictroides]
MEEGTNSWVRRVKFSHTVFHRLDSPLFPSATLSKASNLSSPRQSDHESRLKSRPKPTVVKQVSHDGHVLRNPITNKHRSVSPHTETVVSETFKKAHSDKKRFSTPHPRKKKNDQESVSKLFNKNSGEVSDKSKSCKDSTWTKYFDHGGRRVTAVEAADEWTIDLSKLFLGFRFACGAHSRLYHGMYNDQPVAVKIIRQPDDDENGSMMAQLEKQFKREVTLLSRLHHPNVIKLVGACRESPVCCIITEYLSGGSLRAFLHTFGVVLWELVAGVIPYEHMTPVQAAFAVVNKVPYYSMIYLSILHCTL